MFRSASLKLTAIYLGILLLICLLFNIVLYRVLTQELTRNYSIQSNFFEERPRFQPFIRDPEALSFRNTQLSEGKQHILLELLYVDLALLAAGGFASYWLARRTLEPIEEAHLAQTQFTADASHELRTPLATMQTEIEVALRDPKLKLKDTKDLLKSNLEELSTLRQLTTGLLTLARGEDSSTAHTYLALTKIIDDAIARVQPQAHSRHISLQTVVPKNLKIIGDQAQITEVMTILLDNAVKYSHENTSVIVSAATEDASIIIRVKDTGIGITEADLQHVFDRFYRADNARTKSKQNGHGLGLAIAKQIVKRHGGALKLESNEETGTTATLTIPSAT